MLKTFVCFMAAMMLFSAQAIFAASFTDDFEDGNLDGWVAVDEDDLGDVGPSAWQVQNGALAQTSNIWGDATDAVAIGTFLIYDLAEFTNFTLEVDITPDDNDGMGLIWGWKSRTDHYRFFTMVDSGNSPNGLHGPYRIMEKRISDELPFYAEPHIAEDTTQAYTEGEPVHIKLTVQDGKFSVYMNDMTAPVLEGSDPGYSGGKIGFTLYAQNNIAFDNVVVTEMPAAAVKPAGKIGITWSALKAAH